jgi:hypothetical protein
MGTHPQTMLACVNYRSGARSGAYHRLQKLKVSKVRYILVALVCASPVILLWDGLIMQGLVAGIVAVALVMTARTIRPGETEFLVSIIRTLMVVAAVPALWVLFQVLPLGVFAHPIWSSAEQALGHPVRGAISVDPGASLIALGQYLSMCAVVFSTAAVSVDRHRAEWILFALTAAAAAIALLVLTQDTFLGDVGLSPFSQAPAIDCTGMGIIIAGAACIRTIERYEARHLAPQRSMSILLWTSAGSTAALAICIAALVLDAMYLTIFASLCGLAALVFVWIIRRFGLGPLSIIAIAVPTACAAILFIAYHPPERGVSVPLALARSSASLRALSQRMLDDAPLFGTGAGTFAALAPIYREMDEPPPGSVAETTAATLAIELGKPMFWLIAVATAALILILLRASLRRGRDSFYSAMGGGCLIAVLLLAFANAGLLGTSTGLIVAAALGLAFAQSKSRTLQL